MHTCTLHISVPVIPSEITSIQRSDPPKGGFLPPPSRSSREHSKWNNDKLRIRVAKFWICGFHPASETNYLITSRRIWSTSHLHLLSSDYGYHLMKIWRYKSYSDRAEFQVKTQFPVKYSAIKFPSPGLFWFTFNRYSTWKSHSWSSWKPRNSMAKSPIISHDIPKKYGWI